MWLRHWRSSSQIMFEGMILILNMNEDNINKYKYALLTSKQLLLACNTCARTYRYLRIRQIVIPWEPLLSKCHTTAWRAGLHRGKMGRIFTSHLEGRVYSCKFCKAHLANVEEVVSKVERRLLIFSHLPTDMAFKADCFCGLSVFPLPRRQSILIQCRSKYQVW